jgi:hypothetical protein
LRPNWSSTATTRARRRWTNSTSRLRRGFLALEAAEQLDDLLAHAVEVGAELLQHLGGHALALADQAEQDVLGADVGVAELQRLAQDSSSTFLARGVKGMCPDGACWPWPMISSTWARTASSEMSRSAFERLGGDAFTFVDEAEQDVLGPDVVVRQEQSRWPLLGPARPRDGLGR